jgi:DNA-binding transcriptional LysR family regulator
MEEFFRERSIQPQIGMEMGSNEAIKQAVVAGLGISFISQHTLGLELSAGRLSILQVDRNAGDAPLAHRSPPQQTPDPGPRGFLGFRP